MGAVKLLTKMLHMSLTEQMINEDVERILICHMNRAHLLKFEQRTLGSRAASLIQSLKKRIDNRKQTSEKDQGASGSLTVCAALAEKGGFYKDQDKVTELFNKHYGTIEYIEGQKRRVRDGTLVKRPIEPLSNAFVTAGPMAAKTSLPVPEGCKIIVEQHYLLKPRERVERLMTKIKPLHAAPGDWTQLDTDELSQITAQDDSIVAAVRSKATQTLCVHATRVTEDVYYEGQTWPWIHYHKWEHDTINREIPYTEHETRNGRDKLVTYILIHAPKQLVIQDLKAAELTAKLLHMLRKVTTHPCPEYMLSGRPEEVRQLQEYLDTAGASLSKKGVPMPETVQLQHDDKGRLTAVSDRVNVLTYELEDERQPYTAPLSYQQNGTSKRFLEGITAETVAKRQKRVSTTKAYTDTSFREADWKMHGAAWDHQDPSAKSSSTRIPKGKSELMKAGKSDRPQLAHPKASSSTIDKPA
jgi:hypothetical protein